MYVPTAFAPDDATVRELLSRPQAADLVTMTEDGLVATFLPFVHDPDAGVLRGHLARNNDQWRRPPVAEARIAPRHARNAGMIVVSAGKATDLSPGRAEPAIMRPTWQ